MQHCKSLCAAVTICVTLGNIQTHTRRHLTSFLLSLSVLFHVCGAVDKTSSLVFQRTVK